MNKTIYKPFLGEKSILIILSLTLLTFSTGCTDKSKDNVTAVDTKTYQSNTDVESSEDSSVPSCH